MAAIQVTPMRADDFLEVIAGGGMDWLSKMPPGFAQSLIDGGDAFTGRASGVVIGCAGVIRADPSGRGVGWAVLRPESGRHMLAITRAVLRYIGASSWRRIGADVPVDFAAGHAWMEILGFSREGLARAFCSDGRDATLYGWVRG